MKKTLLLSVVASTMIMAGGDIAPVEPVVETPAVAAASDWDFTGQGVVYYQTRDNSNVAPEQDLFSQEASSANVGLQFGAVNKDVIGGLGMGFELSGLGTLGLEEDVVSGVMQTGDGSLNSAAITQAYLTYGIANTSIKVGRQQLPKALSPFAFSEGWNVFKNTFEAALVVNSDLPDTTLVYAFVNGANKHGNLSQFSRINHDGVHMLTAQNKSVEGLTLTGSYYYAPDMLTTEDVSALWGDAKFGISDYSIGLQGGTIIGPDDIGGKDTTGFGAKIGGNFDMFDASVAYSSVDEGTVAIHNLGTGVKTPLYTQMILNQSKIKSDADAIVVRAGVKALGGKIGAAYCMTTDNSAASNDSTELDVTYKTKVSDSTTLFAGYVMTDEDNLNDARNLVRVWGRYNF